MPRFGNNADIWVGEDGDIWIRVDTAYGSYAYNKTKMDADQKEMLNRPIKFTMEPEPPRPSYSYMDYSSYVTPPIKYPGWVVGGAC